MVTSCVLEPGVSGEGLCAATMLGPLPICFPTLVAATAAWLSWDAELCRAEQKVEEVLLSLQGGHFDYERASPDAHDG